MSVRCKLRLTEVTTYAYGPGRLLKFRAEYDPTIPEDQRFAKASPNGTFEIHIDNPAAFEQFEVGEYYYFDATPVAAGAEASV